MPCWSLLRAIKPAILDVSDIFTDIKTAAWALAETMAITQDDITQHENPL